MSFEEILTFTALHQTAKLPFYHPNFAGATVATFCLILDREGALESYNATL